MPGHSTPRDPWTIGHLVLGSDAKTPIGAISTSLNEVVQFLDARDDGARLRTLPRLHVDASIDRRTVEWFIPWGNDLGQDRPFVIRDNGRKKWFLFEGTFLKSAQGDEYTIVFNHVTRSDDPPSISDDSEE